MATSQTDLGAAPVSEEMSAKAWNENIERNVDTFREFLVENLSVSHLLIFLDDIEEVTLIARRLHHLEDSGDSTQAAREFLDAIKSSDQPGKWTMFVKAVQQMSGDDSVILHKILGGDSSDPWLDNPEIRKLIGLFKEPLKEKLNIGTLLYVMHSKDLIRTDDMKKIEKKLHDGDVVYAQLALIVAMQSHNKHWFKIFLTILYEEEQHTGLAELIDPDFCKKMQEEKNQSQEAEDGKDTELPSHHCDHRKQEAQHTAIVEIPGRGDNRTAVSQSQDKVQPASLAQQHGAENGERATPSATTGQATCGCRCCEQVQSEVAALKTMLQTNMTELAEVKALLIKLTEDGKHQSSC